MKLDKAAKEVVNAIQKFKRFLITSHVNIEGDALGSELALAQLLKKLKKDVYIVNEGKMPANYNFLPGMRTILDSFPRRRHYDAAIVLDCPTLKRIGGISRAIDKRRPILNIDHHISNARFGTINWIDAEAACTGELIYELFSYFGIPLDADCASLLYVAIATDTGSFKYANVTAKTHIVAARLIEAGARASFISHKLYEQNELRKLRLSGAVFSTIRRSEDGKIVWIELTRNMMRRLHSTIDDAEGFVESAASVKGSEIAVFFKERNDGKVSVSFRSRGYVNVNELAKKFGGGGHKGASGCIVTGDMGTVKNKVLKAARNSLR